MPPKHKQITAYPDPTALAIVGGTSPACNWAIECWARVLRESQPELTRAEWNFFADLLNGTWLLDGASSTTQHLSLEVHDGHELNRLGDKWLIEEGGDPAEADAAVKELLAKIAEWNYPTVQYVLAAVTCFWHRAQTVDHKTDDWWTIPFRVKA